MENVEAAGAKRRCVVRGQRFRFWNELGPQVRFRHQNTGLQILLNLCPRSLCFIGRQPLLKHGQAQRVSEFNAVEVGEINREWICLPPRICSGRIRIRNLKRKENAGINVSHQRSSSRDSRTMFGSTFSPKIIRRRAA